MSAKKSVKFHVIFFVITALLLLLDQYTKHLAIVHLKDHPKFSLIEDVFCLQYLENQGAAFGMLQGQKVWFVILTLLFFVLAWWIYHRTPLVKKNYFIFVVLSLLVAGAAGNFIDRITRNYVVDFFYFEWINFPIFNVADIYVTCSIILLLIFFLFFYKEDDFELLWSQIFSSRKGNS